MNEFIRLTEMTQAGTPRHDNCVRLSMSRVTIINNWLHHYSTKPVAS